MIPIRIMKRVKLNYVRNVPEINLNNKMPKKLFLYFFEILGSTSLSPTVLFRIRKIE